MQLWWCGDEQTKRPPDESPRHPHTQTLAHKQVTIVLTSKPVLGSQPTWPMCLKKRGQREEVTRANRHSHSCTSMFVRTFIDSIQSPLCSIIVGNKPHKHTHTNTGFSDMIGQKPEPGTHWKLLGMPMSALVSLFFLPLLFSLRLRMLLRWYGCWGLWEFWIRTLLISGFLMSTVAMWRAGPAGAEQSWSSGPWNNKNNYLMS